MMRSQLLKGMLLSCLTLVAIGSSAATCPTKVERNDEGYWESEQAPGWRSFHKTAEGVSLDVSYFGGVVFSPRHRRMACVYKTSDGQWLALVSEQRNNFRIDKQAMDDSGTRAAWVWNDQHQDYSCGRPHVSDPKRCTFEFD